MLVRLSDTAGNSHVQTTHVLWPTGTLRLHVKDKFHQNKLLKQNQWHLKPLVWAKLILGVICFLIQWKLLCMNIFHFHLPWSYTTVCNTCNEEMNWSIRTWHASRSCSVFDYWFNYHQCCKFTFQNFKQRHQFLVCFLVTLAAQTQWFATEKYEVIMLFHGFVPQCFIPLQRKPLKILPNIRMILQLFI